MTAPESQRRDPQNPGPSLDTLPLPAWMLSGSGAFTSNEEWRTLTGARDADSFDVLLPEEDAERLAELLRHTGAGESGRIELRVVGATGEMLAFDCAVRGLSAEEGGGHLGVCYDVTDSRLQERRLSYMATHDSLTGLPNRWLFEETLRRAVCKAERGEAAVVMMMDIDNFKAYNDTYGHLAGDQALVNIALLLHTHLRAADLLARFGGDEFAVLLEGSGVEEAREVAERMTAAAAGEFVAHAVDVGLGLSIGLAAIIPGQDHDAVLHHADAALYRAKRRGRGRVVLA